MCGPLALRTSCALFDVMGILGGSAVSMERYEGYRQLARKFVVDAVTAEVASAFAGEGIGSVVLKGPVLAKWLYPGEVRSYGDSDLLVAPGDRARAVSVLQRLRFVAYLPGMLTLLPLDEGPTKFSRGGDVVDLHSKVTGLDGDPDAVWGWLATSAERQVIGGTELRVPDRDMVLLHVVMHASQHWDLVDGQPLEDLRRALARVEESQLSRALELARTYRGVRAFAAGLRLLPEGGDLARRLDLRREDVIAEDLYALLSADSGIRQQVVIAAKRSFPLPDYMRWWSPLARRGRLGLAFAYLWRAIWLIGQAPGAIYTLWRIRRAKGRA